jgi:hypothetical protein
MHVYKLDNLIADSLRFEYIEGGVTEVEYPYTTGWRTLPFAVVSQWIGGPMFVEWAGTAGARFESGQAVLVPPGVRHCVTVSTPSTSTCRWAHLEFTALGSVSLLSLLKSPRQDLRRIDTGPPLYTKLLPDNSLQAQRARVPPAGQPL